MRDRGVDAGERGGAAGSRGRADGAGGRGSRRGAIAGGGYDRSEVAVDIVALGEWHGQIGLDSDLRLALVRHPDFAKSAIHTSPRRWATATSPQRS